MNIESRTILIQNLEQALARSQPIIPQINSAIEEVQKQDKVLSVAMGMINEGSRVAEKVKQELPIVVEQIKQYYEDRLPPLGETFYNGIKRVSDISGKMTDNFEFLVDHAIPIGFLIVAACIVGYWVKGYLSNRSQERVAMEQIRSQERIALKQLKSEDKPLPMEETKKESSKEQEKELISKIDLVEEKKQPETVKIEEELITSEKTDSRVVDIQEEAENKETLPILANLEEIRPSQPQKLDIQGKALESPSGG